MQTGNWFKAAKCPDINKPAYQVMERVKGELTFCTTFNIVLRGTRFVITEELQQCVVALAHKGHQGIVKTKALLREKGWFTGINTTEKKVKSSLMAKGQRGLQRTVHRGIPTCSHR